MNPRFIGIGAIVLVGCAGGDEPTPLPPASANYSGGLGAEPDFSDPHGLIEARLFAEDGMGSAMLQGAFADGPRVRFHQESQRIGSCRLMTYAASSCEPACAPGAACVDGACVPYPTRATRGTLTWSYPGGSMDVEPDGTDGYFRNVFDVTGDGPMTLAFDGLVLEVPSAPPLLPAGDWSAVLAGRARGADATLAWTNPMQGARVRLSMTDCTGSHGGLAAAELECEGPDTGELTLPGAFVDQLDDGDWSRGECGGHPFERYHAAAPDGDALTRFEARGPGTLFHRP